MVRSLLTLDEAKAKHDNIRDKANLFGNYGGSNAKRPSRRKPQ